MIPLKSGLNKHYQIIVIGLALGIIIFLDPLSMALSGIPYISIENYASITDRILLVTFFGLLWYSWETRKLRITTHESLRFEQAPLLTVTTRTENGDIFLKVRNIGRGSALDIDVSVSDAQYRCEIEEGLRFMPPNDEKCVIFIERANSSRKYRSFLHTQLSKKTISVELKCKDASGTHMQPFKYTVEGAVGSDEHRVSLTQIGKAV